MTASMEGTRETSSVLFCNFHRPACLGALQPFPIPFIYGRILVHISKCVPSWTLLCNVHAALMVGPATLSLLNKYC